MVYLGVFGCISKNFCVAYTQKSVKWVGLDDSPTLKLKRMYTELECIQTHSYLKSVECNGTIVFSMIMEWKLKRNSKSWINGRSTVYCLFKMKKFIYFEKQKKPYPGQNRSNSHTRISERSPPRSRRISKNLVWFVKEKSVRSLRVCKNRTWITPEQTQMVLTWN
jgi:hypothetical protein